MVLQDKDIIGFQNLYRKYFGKEISRENAYEQGIKLLRLTALVYQPMTIEELRHIQERRKKRLPVPTN